MALFKMAGHLIRRLNQNSNAIFNQRVQDAGFDLTPVQFAAMMTLKDNPNIEQALLATMIAYDRATIGGVIDRLRHKGFVARVVDKKDRRARLCSLTPLGEKTLQDILPIVESLQLEILSGLDDEERELFLSLANKVINYDQ